VLQENKDKSMFELEIKQLAVEVKRAKESKPEPQVDFRLPHRLESQRFLGVLAADRTRFRAHAQAHSFTH
jgi:hypothetical protein